MSRQGGLCVPLSLQGTQPQSTEATLPLSLLSHHIENDCRSAVSPSLLHHPPCHPCFAAPALSPSLTCSEEALNQQQDSEQGQFCDTVCLTHQPEERTLQCLQPGKPNLTFFPSSFTLHYLKGGINLLAATWQFQLWAAGHTEIQSFL